MTDYATTNIKGRELKTGVVNSKCKLNKII
jgi:hypothetical protein